MENLESLKDILQIKSSIGHKMATLKFQELMLYISEKKGVDLLNQLS